MASSQLRFSPLSNPFKTHFHKYPSSSRNTLFLRSSTFPNPSTTTTTTTTGGGGGGGGGGISGGGSNSGGWSSDDGAGGGGKGGGNFLLSGWRSRVAADPEFPFKVLMEEVVGLSATAVGDMASRPNFGLSELDLVLSTVVVGSIVNFVLMYILAPTSSASSASSLPAYIFQPGSFPLLARAATFFYKGLLFAAVGFASGLAGTTLSNALVAMKDRTQNEDDQGGEEKEEKKKKKKKSRKGPPTVLNAATWAVHMGLSSNIRYQTLNGVEFVLAGALPPPAFKLMVLLLRGLNNMLGGMSFVALGKLMGSQKTAAD